MEIRSQRYSELAWPYQIAQLWKPGLATLQHVLADKHRPGIALDLGCGTGQGVAELANHGWQVWGLDYSQAMLTQAHGQAAHTAAFIQADITSPELLHHPGMPATVDLIVCVGDTIAELTTPAELLQVLQHAARLLAPAGELVIDTRTTNTLAQWDDRDEVLWDADGLLLYAHRRYNPRTCLATSRYGWFMREETCWWHNLEQHSTRHWTLEEMKQATQLAGLRLAKIERIGGQLIWRITAKLIEP